MLCISKYAIKFPAPVSYIKFLSGLIANKYEVNHYRYAVKWNIFPKEKMCPILFKLPVGVIIVMRRAEPLSMEQFIGFDFDSFVYINNNAILPVERKNDSFGYVDGKIVAIDYE